LTEAGTRAGGGQISYLPADIFRAAWEKGKLELCAEMYKQFHDRLHGRPFIAANPEQEKKANAIRTSGSKLRSRR
jgi:hypothetical protein